MDLVFVQLEGPAEAVLEDQAFLDFGIQIGGEELKIVLALVLGPVHGGIRVLQKDRRFRAVIGTNGNPDTARNIGLLLAQHERLAEGIENTLGDDRGILTVGQPGHQNGKLVPPQPGHRIAAADAEFQSERRLPE